MRGRYLRGMCACILMPVLGSCRAFEASRCSAPDVVDTVKSLSMGGDNPLAAALFQAMKPTVSLDAIRTISSGSSETLCEGRLTISVPVTARSPQEGLAPAETAGNPVEQELSTKRIEVTYKLEKTDDGRTYVTIIPSEADILGQQSRQRQYQEQEYQQQQENRAEEQRQIDRQQQYEDNLEERWRQHD